MALATSSTRNICAGSGTTPSCRAWYYLIEPFLANWTYTLSPLVHDDFWVAQMGHFGEVAFYDDGDLEDPEGEMSASCFVVESVGDLGCVLCVGHGRGGVQASYAPDVAQSIYVKVRKCWLQRRTKATAGVESFS